MQSILESSGPTTRQRAAAITARIEEENRIRLITEMCQEVGPHDIVLTVSHLQIKVEAQSIVKQEVSDAEEPPPDSEQVVVEIKEEEVEISPTPPPDHVNGDISAHQDDTSSSVVNEIEMPIESTQAKSAQRKDQFNAQFERFKEELDREFAQLKEQQATKDLRIHELERKVREFVISNRRLEEELEMLRAKLGEKNVMARGFNSPVNYFEAYPNLKESHLLGEDVGNHQEEQHTFLNGQNVQALNYRTALLQTGNRDPATNAHHQAFYDGGIPRKF